MSFTSTLSSAFYFARKGLGIKDRIVGSEFCLSGLADRKQEQLVAVETKRGGGEYKIISEVLHFHRGAGWYPTYSDIDKGPYTRDEAADFIFRSDDARLNDMITRLGLEDKIQKDAFKAKFYSQSGLPVNHSARIVLARNQNDVNLIFPMHKNTR